MKTNYKTQTPDDLNPGFTFGITPTALLMRFATGELNAAEATRTELASRGIGTNGTWVGFDIARAEWEAAE